MFPENSEGVGRNVCMKKLLSKCCIHFDNKVLWIFLQEVYLSSGALNASIVSHATQLSVWKILLTTHSSVSLAYKWIVKILENL